MKLYAEIPKFWLKTLSPLFDGDFALAQLVLEDTELLINLVTIGLLLTLSSR
jgi:hypothetical protein